MTTPPPTTDVLVIRDAQLAALAARAAERFEDRMLRHVASEFPGVYQRLGAERARALIHHAIDYGAERRIRCEGPVAALIELWVTFGPELERSPLQDWGLEMLDHVKMPGSLRLRLVREELTSLTGGRAVVPVDEEA